jgi:hypothetical protein
MADAKNPIPSPQPGDSEDLELALETAQRMYSTGDSAEALKWLRRAASAAEEAGDDLRQLQLARLAADLAAVVNAGPPVVSSAPSVPPAGKPGGTPSRLPQPPAKQPPPAPSARGSVAPGPIAQSKPSAAPGLGGMSQPLVGSGGPPPLPAKPRPTPPSVAAAVAPARAVPESQPPPPRSTESQSPPAPKVAVPSIKPKPVEPTGSGTIAAAKPIAAATPSLAPVKADRPSSSTPSGFIDIGARSTMRVSVRVSARDEELFIVRPLAQGQRVPSGAREARLVFEQDAAAASSQSHGE